MNGDGCVGIWQSGRAVRAAIVNRPLNAISRGLRSGRRLERALNKFLALALLCFNYQVSLRWEPTARRPFVCVTRRASDSPRANWPAQQGAACRQPSIFRIAELGSIAGAFL
ncbi:hypothetical protein GOBAR_DD35806 [Gossypium barbadense]|nr:hypothetical protein GOBAR_DD35806 [Gossypium barbadense]